MMTVRLIAIDLEDTLLRRDQSISFRVKNAVKKAATAGVTVALVSGRVPAALAPFSRVLGLHKRSGCLICNNGAVIRESHTGKTLFEAFIPREIGLIMYDLAHAEGFSVQLYEHDTMFVSRSNEFAGYDEKVTGQKQVLAENFREMVAAGCHKLIIPGDPMILGPLEELLRSYAGDDVTLLWDRAFHLEILPSQTDRGLALARLARSLRIGYGETLVIGNSLIDESMFRWAGSGAALANADERIKAQVAFVSEKTNEDDGAAEIIERALAGKAFTRTKEQPAPLQLDEGTRPDRA
jgi:Cof subfamily protein (haloacid dehalogenase superfamily)